MSENDPTKDIGAKYDTKPTIETILGNTPDKESNLTAIISGNPLNTHLCIIAALVARLGGEVRLSALELDAVTGLTIYEDREGKLVLGQGARNEG